MPEIDVHCREAIGRSWQLSTLQVDFQLPARFDLEYQDADGTRRRPHGRLTIRPRVINATWLAV